MFNDPTLTLADQLTGIIAVFCRTVAAEACRMGALSVAIWNRVKRLERRFCALHAMWKAGTLPKARPGRGTAPLRLSASSAVKCLDRGERRGAQSEGAEAAACDAARLAGGLPRELRWMQRMLPRSAGTLASMFGALVENHPDMRAFVAEVPQVGRVLRPLLRMAGLAPPEWLRLPKRPGVSVADASPRPRGSSPGASLPHSGEGEVKGRRRTPREMALAAREKARRTGKPVDWKKLSSRAAGYLLHWPRDEHCPPPEVGYAPSRWRARVPKDYAGFLQKWD